MYLSFKSTVSIGDITAESEDIVLWDGGSGYSIVFDGSDVGLAGYVIDGFDVIADDEILLTFTTPIEFPGVGKASGSDILLFTGSLGSATAGSFSMYFVGAQVGLNKESENVNGVTRLSDGSLLLTTSGAFSANGLSGNDEDVIRFFEGTLTMYFDGSDVGVGASGDDVDAVASDGVDLYLSFLSPFLAEGASGDPEDVFTFSGTFGSSTSGTYLLFWDGTAYGTTVDIGGIDLA